ncbi:maestro heat-like repeat-containing protein family member 7 [Liasis olivaceus]
MAVTCEVIRAQGWWDNEEAHFSGFQLPTSHNPASQRTSQLLPLAIGVAAFCHLSEILTALRDFLSERYIRTTLLLCYGQAAIGARPEDMLLLVEHIVSEIPPLDPNVRSELVNKSIQKVFSLPALKMTKVKANDFYQQTIIACNSMLTSLLSEAPSLESLQDNIWIDSPTNYERERAIKSTRHLLKFVSEHFDQLVALLALHSADSVREIGQASAEATYHLHHIIMNKMAKEMEKKRKNKKGKVVQWMRVDYFNSGPTTFYNNIPKVAEAFGEHLSSSQITELVLKAIGLLTHEEKKISQDAALVLSSFLEECGMDLPTIIKEVHRRLPRITDPATKEETLRSVCHLGSKRLSRMVDILLECSVECDSLLKRLQDEMAISEDNTRRNSKSLMPIAATNAVCFILSLPEASDALQNKFPSMLIGLATQIKTLIVCAGYTKECNILGTIGCWDLLYHPEIGLIFMKEDILHVLHEWMVQPYPTSRALSIRGLGYLMRHSLEVRDGVLESKNACYREAAAILIACSAQYMKPDVVTVKEVEDVFLGE